MPFFLREEKVNHKGTEVTEQGILKPSGFCPVPAARPKPQAPRLNSNQDPMAGVDNPGVAAGGRKTRKPFCSRRGAECAEWRLKMESGLNQGGEF